MAVEKEQTIIGTAGHIDHGKTALVKALTGIDADTLAEEKKRGITIELGFVFMEAPDFDKQIVFIDVPGHEKLIKTMVAGASNIDAALLVVAADEGISAQTVEHFDILQLLGLESGVIALTKADLVDDSHIYAVSTDVRNFVAGTFLEDAPVIPVSAVTGAGVEEVRSALLAVSGRAGKRHDTGVFRMPIDRAFTMQGFGTVIAGTVLAGSVKVGDRLEIQPDGISAKVRGIQVHGRSVQESVIGRRTGVNLQDVKKEQLRRGQCACAPGSLAPTNRLDARLQVLRSFGGELKNGMRIRLHVGTDEAMSRLALLGAEKLGPGQTGIVQFVLESPTVAVPKDRFVIRTFSPLRTIGGGTILDARPPKHKGSDTAAVDALKKLEGDLGDAVEQAFVKSRHVPQSPSEIALAIGESEAEVAEVADGLAREGKLVTIPAAGGEKYLHATHFDELAGKLTDILDAFYAKEPYRLFMPAADLQSQFLKYADRQVFEAALAHLAESVALQKEGARIGLPGRRIAWKSGEEDAARRVEAVFRETGYATPLADDVRQRVGVSPESFRNIMGALIEQGALVRLSDSVTYHRGCVEAAKEVVVRYIKEKGSITVAELRDELGLSRKYSIAILEYFDAIHFTRRDGDRRLLR